MPGFGDQMRQISLKFVPTAILSRQVAVIRDQTLIINLPGQPKAMAETLEGLKDAQGQRCAAAVPAGASVRRSLRSNQRSKFLLPHFNTTGSVMPQKAWRAKRKRQYSHIKDNLLEVGKPESVAQKIAARVVNKERAQHGESVATLIVERLSRWQCLSRFMHYG